jgi:DNA phosphorothioation system restriction enzyme
LGSTYLSLRDVGLVGHYRSSRSSLLRAFALPCLAASVRYDRAVGYFTSTVLAAEAEALYPFVRKPGRVRMVVSPVLTKEDVEAMSQGYERRDAVIERALLREFDPATMPDPVSQPLGCLAWLISEGLLDIKVAILESGYETGMYHEKLGVFEDSDGNRVAFTGSANESFHGLVANFEAIEVYRSWVTEDVPRLKQRIQDFEDLWDDKTPTLAIVPFPEAVRERLLQLKPDRAPEPPSWMGLGVGVRRPSANELSPPVTLKLRDYQKDAVASWFKAGGRGIWEMATGTGKTIAALSLVVQVVRRATKAERSVVVIVVCPYRHLVSQWAAEARGFATEPILCMESYERWFDQLSIAISSCNEGAAPFAIAIVTNDTLESDRFQECLARVRCDGIFIGDEVHNLGAEQMRRALPDGFQYRLGLSATPERWYDRQGTNAIYAYFGPVVYELRLEEAIRMGALVPYYYFPHAVELDGDEIQVYVELSEKIAKVVAYGADLSDETDNEILRHLLIRRSRLIGQASGKVAALRAAMSPLTQSKWNLVYCGDGQAQIEPGGPMIRQLDAVVHMIGNELGMTVNSYTAETYLDERHELRQAFAAGRLQALVAIRCLDEGVDIPEMRRAFILASSTNPKQFIQRRGRVLRLSHGKSDAEIHDFIVVAPQGSLNESTHRIERGLLKRELERVSEFARIALNGPQAVHELIELRRRYGLLEIG